METLKKGSRGENVKTLQKKLNLIADGAFGAITEEAVKAFQKAHGLTPDGIVGAKTWAALGCTLSRGQNSRVVTEIIVHCSATPEGREFDVDAIRACHLARGFSDIGYHWVIYLDGTIHKGRDESKVGAHCTSHNANSIGVCYVGGCERDNINIPKDTRTPLQRAALVRLLKELKARYPKAKIYGHRDFANKACPSFDATKEYKDL